MSKDQSNNELKLAWSIFKKLVDLPLKDAQLELQRHQEIDGEIKRKVSELLKNSSEHDTTFDELADAFILQGAPELVDLSGHEVGDYQLLNLVGRGGMSSVYEAQRNDSKIQKKVAIKIMHPYSVSRTSMRMFDREQLALSQLDHPNIISFHHGGSTSEGMPFLVTDYIENAQIISEYVNDKKLSNRDVIILFLQVLDAIRYAHANLIIHRDIKPSNILIDTNGHLKVVDFGIATLDSELKDQTTVVFTPEYAAPEQLIGQTITTQADVFSLGVVLLSLLSARKPLPDYKHRMVDESNDEQRIREVLQKIDLEADLKNIILQATRRDPKQRYYTVADLQQDLSNWLDKKPVLATKDTFIYRTKMFVFRNKAASMLLIATFSSLIIGVMTTVYQKNIAENEAHKANEVKSFLLNALASNDPDILAGRTLSVKDLLLEAQSKLTQKPVDDAELQAELLQTIGTSLGKIGEFEPAIKQLETAKLMSKDSAATEIEIIGLLFESKQYDMALSRLSKLLAIIDQDLADSYQVTQLRIEEKNYLGEFGQAELIITTKLSQSDISVAQRIELNLMLANTYLNGKKNTEAEQLLLTTLDLSSKENGEVNSKTIDIIQDLARFYENQSENGIEQSISYLKRAVQLQQDLYQTAHPKLIISLIRLANNYKALGQDQLAYEEASQAKQMAIELYGEKNIFAARADAALSHLALKSGDLNQAIALLAAAVEVYENHYGADHFETNQYKTNLASYLLKAGDANRSLELLNQLYEHQLEQLGANHMATLYVQLNQIKALSMLSKFEEAISIGEEIFPICEAELGADQAITVGVVLALGVAYFENQDFRLALDFLSRGEQSLVVRSNPSYHQGLLIQLITASIETEQVDLAKSFYNQAASLYLGDRDTISDELREQFSVLQEKIGGI